MTKRLIGVDIGGTNTDLIFIDQKSGRLITAKVPTTAGNQAEGLIDGVRALGVDLSEVDLLIHGTTVATNAAIERKGARCGLITTLGFRDVLELRRRDRPHTYGLRADFMPLIARRDRREVPERISAEGEVLEPLDLAALKKEVISLRDSGCEVLVISFLHCYANPAHERAARDAALALWPSDYVVISSDVLPAIREFERCSTATISGYVQPLIGRYLDSLSGKLGTAGLARELLVVQSNGGVMAAPLATRFAANTILSGPAAGVTAAASIANDLKISNAISCDIGGTSLDICVIRNGEPSMTQQSSIGFGLPLALPMLDVDAVGTGGGSYARLDRAGLLQVGPQSAGALPGPVCYGRGGTIPTVTDACLVAGLLDPEMAIGKSRGAPMNRDLSRRALLDKIGTPLGIGAEEAAEAVLTVAGAKMAGHVRRNLLARGLDPRDFSVIAFGGAGPLHANRLLREVGLARVVIPFFPGITSAMGCVLGQLRHDFMRTVNRTLSQLANEDLQAICKEHADEGRGLLVAEGASEADIVVSLAADMCYRGQSNVIPVSFPSDKPATWANVRASFEEAYRERYSRLLDDCDISLVNVRVRVSADSIGATSIASLIELPEGPSPKGGSTQVYFGGGWRTSSVFNRHELSKGTVVAGPALLLQADTTTFIEPGFQACVHPTGNILIEAI